jgi:hypothetical protein
LTEEDNLMDLLPGTELDKLTGKPRGACVSIFLPTHRAGAETRQDPIRLKNLLDEAEERLVARGLRTPETGRLLEPPRDLLADDAFWRHQGDGLALFLSSDEFRYYRLPLSFEELVVVADRYHLKPLLPLLVEDGQFYVLALSQNGVRLLQATRHTVEEVELKDVPESLADALNRDGQEKQLQFHTGTSGGGGSRPAVFHGHGIGDEGSKDDILRYFRQVDRGVWELLKGRWAPLVLAGVAYLLPIYREASAYPNLVDEGVTGNPEGLRAQELHEKTWEVMRTRFLKAQREAIVRYEQYAGTGLTSTDLETVVPAAYFGRVDLLFVTNGSHRWGIFDPAAGEARLHRKTEARDGDLVDFAAVQTLLNGGTVYALDPEEMPEEADVTSVFRY